ncbi:hypothetical protein AGMMS49940_14550 [Spirochaetia bacterium]|nr:hypothetical protein AGMMS49940_14550 [Spirochaetia bacterium]
MSRREAVSGAGAILMKDSAGGFCRVGAARVPLWVMVKDAMAEGTSPPSSDLRSAPLSGVGITRQYQRPAPRPEWTKERVSPELPRTRVCSTGFAMPGLSATSII